MKQTYFYKPALVALGVVGKTWGICDSYIVRLTIGTFSLYSMRKIIFSLPYYFLYKRYTPKSYSHIYLSFIVHVLVLPGSTESVTDNHIWHIPGIYFTNDLLFSLMLLISTYLMISALYIILVFNNILLNYFDIF